MDGTAIARPFRENRRVVARKKRCTFMIEPEVLDRLRTITARTGVTASEQIREGIRWWLESREWPVRGGVSADSVTADETPAAPPRPSRNGRRAASKHR